MPRSKPDAAAMPVAVTMPRLGLSMAEGTVVEWHVRAGERVERGAPLLTVESEKAQVEVEAFASGVLAAVYVAEGTTVPVGALLGAIAAPGEAFAADGFAASFVPEVERVPSTTGRRSAGEAPSHPVPSGPEPKAAPAARALARRRGIELATVAGTGPGGRITVEDVERAAAVGGEVDASGLSYVRAGTGTPLLFVAGYGVDASAWRRQLDDLASDFTVVAYDHRGIARSQMAPDPPASIADLAADARALVASLGLPPSVVVGASMGAAVALELALAEPGAVRALVLVTPVLERDARFEAVLRGWSAHEVPTSEARIRAMLPWLLGRELLGHAGRREAAAAALRAMASRTPAATLRRHADLLLAWLGTRGPDLSRIEVPALVVAGGDDVLAPRAHAEAVARGLPRARLEMLEGAGHAIMIERAAELNALIRAFAAANR